MGKFYARHPLVLGDSGFGLLSLSYVRLRKLKQKFHKDQKMPSWHKAASALCFASLDRIMSVTQLLAGS